MLFFSPDTHVFFSLSLLNYGFELKKVTVGTQIPREMNPSSEKSPHTITHKHWTTQSEVHLQVEELTFNPHPFLINSFNHFNIPESISEPSTITPATINHFASGANQTINNKYITNRKADKQYIIVIIFWFLLSFGLILGLFGTIVYGLSLFAKIANEGKLDDSKTFTPFFGW